MKNVPVNSINWLTYVLENKFQVIAIAKFSAIALSLPNALKKLIWLFT